MQPGEEIPRLIRNISLIPPFHPFILSVVRASLFPGSRPARWTILILLGLGTLAMAGVASRQLSAHGQSSDALALLPNHLEATILSNDSLLDVCWSLSQPWDSSEAMLAFDLYAPDWSCLQVLWDTSLHSEQWDTLPQIRFWKRIMALSKDTVIVSIASSRTILGTMPLWAWESMGDTAQAMFRDSVRLAHGLGPETPIYATAGKNHYYQFEMALPGIGKGIQAFQENGVDPWFAQAILLIESPGQLHMSPVGAYGSFQLMKTVAEEYGLIVSDSLDEREDFSRAAYAASELIRRRCLPQVRGMLRKRNLAFSETDLWFRLLVLHAYHAGAGNVESVLAKIQPVQGGVELMRQVWTTEVGGFKNASQNYSQIALASFLRLEEVMQNLPDSICQERILPEVAVERVKEES